MKDIVTFEELYEAYILCLKNKKNKAGVNVKNFCSFLAKKYVGFWQSYLEGRVPLF